LNILLDQNLTEYLRDLLPGHNVTHAFELGWDRLGNGELLNAAEQAGFNAMLTADQNVPHQNRLQGRRIAVVILSTNRWPTIRQAANRILEALDGLTPGECRRVILPRPPLRRRPAPGSESR
jgi:predicted nuclease of predicted toxin-antitoxin system